MSSNWSKEELVRRAYQGDPVAVQLLLAEAGPRLRRRLTPRIPDALRGKIDADDLLQEVYFDVKRGIEHFRPQGDFAFDRWLATVALRRLRAEVVRLRARKRGGDWRHLRRAPAGLQESTITLLRLISGNERTPSSVVAGREVAAHLQAALDELRPAYAEAVRLVHLEGCSLPEAAKAMNRTEAAVRNLCYKAKRQLKRMMGDPGSGPRRT